MTLFVIWTWRIPLSLLSSAFWESRYSEVYVASIFLSFGSKRWGWWCSRNSIDQTSLAIVSSFSAVLLIFLLSLSLSLATLSFHIPSPYAQWLGQGRKKTGTDEPGFALQATFEEEKKALNKIFSASNELRCRKWRRKLAHSHTLALWQSQRNNLMVR